MIRAEQYRMAVEAATAQQDQAKAVLDGLQTPQFRNSGLTVNRKGNLFLGYNITLGPEGAVEFALWILAMFLDPDSNPKPEPKKETT